MQFIARQGLAVRGKEATDGNFVKLLELRSDDDDVLKRWLTRTTSYTSVTVQNEILRIMAHMVLRDICNDIRYFAVIVDGTQDIQGVEQESICVRYVDDAYHVHEDFVGLYNVEDTTGASLSHMLQDALLQLNLPIANLRAQTYDGASNMAGKYQGCQALIKTAQPLAHYTHCGAHVTPLVCAKAVESAPFIRDALHVVQELGGFYNASGKFKHLYLEQQVPDGSSSPARLKPLCPTRWLSRGVAVNAVWRAFFTFNPYLLISRIHLLISRIHLWISRIHLLISRIHLLISIIHLLISIIHFLILIKMEPGAIFIDINK